MADGYERSRSLSTGSLNDTYHSSPTNYVEARVNYEEEGMCRAFKDVAKLALPITITSLFVSALLFCNLVWIGRHASNTEYAGAALGNMLVNVMGNSIIIGMTTGLDTQCGQAFGAQIYKMVGVFLQRSICISHFVVVVIAIVFWQGDYILIGLGQNHKASMAAGIFCKVFVASLWPIAMFANLRRFLQAQRKVVFIPIAVFMGLCAQIIALVILVNVLGFGYKGACFALPMSYWAMFGTLFLFTRWKKLHEECWPGWGKWAFKDWFVFLKLTVPGTLMLCAEWWAFEVLALVAGTMNAGGDCNDDHPKHCYNSTTYVAAFTTCLNVLGIFIRIPLGISFACAVLVSNKLGAKLGNSARLVFNAAIILSVSLCSLCSAFLFFFPEVMAKVYTNDPSIRHVVTETLPYLAIYFAIDSFQRCCAGGTRGMGRQAWGAGIYVVSYYCIGMPLGIWFGKCGFFGRGEPMYLKGLWVGAGISVTVCAFFFICLRLCVNWDREVVRAQKRLQREQEAIEQFKEDLKRGMDDETMNKLLREPHPSVNEGHYIKYSDGGHQHIHITEDSVSGRTYDNVDNIEYYEDMTFGADENDATLNEHTLDSNVLAFRSNSGANSLRNTNDLTSPLDPSQNDNNNNNNINNFNQNNAALNSMGSLPSVSYVAMKKSTSQPGYGYAVNSQESTDFSSKHINDNNINNNNINNNNINNNTINKDSFDEREHEINGHVEPPSKMETTMNGNLSIDVGNDDDVEMNEENDNNDDDNDNENENENENDNDNEDENHEQNGRINGTVDKDYNNNSQVGTPRKSGLPKKALKKKKKRRKNKNKNKTNNASLGHQHTKQGSKHQLNNGQADDRID